MLDFKEIEKAKSEKGISEDINCILFTTLPESDEASFNTTNILDVDGSSSFELTKAELIGREQVWQVVKFLQNDIPGFKNPI